MPYADKDYGKAYYRKKYAEKYRSSPTFRKAEAARKSEWYHRDIEAQRERVRKPLRPVAKAPVKGKAKTAPARKPAKALPKAKAKPVARRKAAPAPARKKAKAPVRGKKR
jgi:hypothetical protein